MSYKPGRTYTLKFGKSKSGGSRHRGYPRTIIVEKLGNDGDTPLSIRQALAKGVYVTVYQTGKESGLPGVHPEAMVTRTPNVINALRHHGEIAAANELKRLCPNQDDLYVFEPGIFRIVAER